ncbi:LacI family DNA-binding transcriptional regulator, partial [Actinotignum timonense]|uniref:LacI family DNA-binding transcriptional regulator n=1 Tax=Actinotignum timonense TaxID=1870995 RepID=UPI002A7EA8E7
MAGVGMKDVASRAGVSITTVSHVLNGTRRVAESTRMRVLEAAAELGYSSPRTVRTCRLFTPDAADDKQPGGNAVLTF